MLQLANDMSTFNEIFTDMVNEIKNKAFAMGECWNDPQYEDFLNMTEELMAQLSANSEKLRTIEWNLREKVKIIL